MIRYALTCDHAHEFEGWFGSSGDYDDQLARGLLECPVCASKAVRKQIMAPAVSGTKKTARVEAPEGQTQAMMMEALSQVRAYVEENFDDVGDAFAREARAIHEGRSEQRGIYGQASQKDVRELVQDGIPVAPMPPEAPKKTDVN
ncbi:DUF1178 family protein [Phenylobacterium deserti]|uniref:DUF1178 domain-containing protein n=1 Tax=Phenylobacterium deserti TaxID=1914756 RepID=A0A328A9W3_9CAUL|nr:DUF1178 family protein [Phenylobacterium deserti]RAK51503.1 DUF1178 domain-containing protein [Phenylobacterium deserti]